VRRGEVQEDGKIRRGRGRKKGMMMGRNGKMMGREEG